MAENQLKFEIIADTAKAEKSTKDFQKKSVGAFKKLGSKIGSATSGLATFGLALDAASKIFAGLDKISDKFIATQKTMARAKFFGASNEAAKAFNRSLGNSLSKLEAIAQVTEMKALGFSSKDINRAGEMARVMSFVGGISRQSALEMIQNGEASAQLLEKMGTSAGLLELALDKRGQALDAELRTLDKSKVLMNLLTKSIQRGGKSLGELAKKDIVSPFAKLKVLFKNLVDALVVKLVPKFKAFIKSMGGFDVLSGQILKTWGQWLKVIDKGVQLIKDLRSGKKSITGFILKDIASTLLKPFTSSTLGKATRSSFKKRKPLPKFKARTPEEQAKVIKSLKPLAPKKPPTPRRTQAQQDALDRIKSMVAESRERIADFLSFGLDAVSNLGGTVSGLFSSMRDLPELMDKHLANPKVNRELVQRLGVQKMLSIIGGKDLKVNLAKIDVLIKQRKISVGTGKAFKEMTIQAKGGLADQDEYLANLKKENMAIRANLIPIAAQAKLVELATAEKDRIVDAETALNQIKMVQNMFEKHRLELLQKAGKANKQNKNTILAKAGIVQTVVDRLKKQASQYTIQNNQIMESLKLTKEKAALEKEMELIATRTAGANAVFALRENLQGAKLALAELQGKEVSVSKIRLANAMAEASMGAKQIAIADRLKKTRFDLKASEALGNLEAVTQEKQRIKDLNTQLRLLERIHGVQVKTGEERVRQAEREKGFMGGVRAGFSSQIELAKQWSKSSSKVIGENFGSVLNNVVTMGTGAIEALGGLLVNAFAGKDDAFGEFGRNTLKAILSFIGDTAAQFAALFGAIGLGAMFVPGMQVNAGGMLAAAAGLAALAGISKAGASLVGEKTPAKAGGPSSASTGSTSAGMGSETFRTRNTQEVFVVVNSMPWQGDEKQQARRFRDFLKRNNRTIGGMI